MTTLTRAFNEWANRPADERFTSLADLDAACRHGRSVSRESFSTLKRVRLALGDKGQPVLQNDKGRTSEFTHWSFGQFSRLVGAPVSYLRQLPGSLAVQNLKHGLDTMEDRDRPRNLLLAKDGKTTLRAITTAETESGRNYKRVWNSDITKRLIELVGNNPEWQPAPAAFDGSRGLYASDHDMFAFLVDNERRIFETDKGGGLGRGFFIWNSEVGSGAFGISAFLYEYVCGNHRVWGAKTILEVKTKHVGDADVRAFAYISRQLSEYANASAKNDEARIRDARKHLLGKTREEVLMTVKNFHFPQLSQSTAKDALTIAEREESKYGNPFSAWGFTGGLTQYARDLPNTDDRLLLDRVAGKILDSINN